MKNLSFQTKFLTSMIFLCLLGSVEGLEFFYYCGAFLIISWFAGKYDAWVNA